MLVNTGISYLIETMGSTLHDRSENLSIEPLLGLGSHRIEFHDGRGYYYFTKDHSLSIGKRTYTCTQKLCNVTARMDPNFGSLIDNERHSHAADLHYRDKCLLLQVIQERFQEETLSASEILQEVLDSVLESEDDIDDGSSEHRDLTLPMPENIFLNELKQEPNEEDVDVEANDGDEKVDVEIELKDEPSESVMAIESDDLGSLNEPTSDPLAPERRKSRRKTRKRKYVKNSNERNSEPRSKKKTPTDTSGSLLEEQSFYLADTPEDNFREALLKEKKAQDTSDLASCAESDTGKGHRIKKPNHRLYSDSESDCSEDIPSPQLKRPREDIPSPQLKRPRESFSEDISSPQLKRPQESFTTNLSPRSTSSFSKSFLNERSEGTFLSRAQTPSSSRHCDHEGTCLKMQEQQERMERMLLLLRSEVKEVLDVVTQMAKAPQSRVLASIENDSRTRFSSQFPISSLEDFLQLEDSLKDDESSKLMIEFFTQVGGNSLEDSIRRTLTKLLTNEVAVNFSWEGRKGKRALNSLAVVKMLERVLVATYSNTFTNKVYETRLREWFRQAGTRISNKLKKNF